MRTKKTTQFLENEGPIIVLTELRDFMHHVKKTHEDVLWAEITLGNYIVSTDEKSCVHIETTEYTDVLATFKDYSYDGHELFGTIAFKDNTWISRENHEGAEWWQYHEYPETPTNLKA